jgi:hypothetical protein
MAGLLDMGGGQPAPADPAAQGAPPADTVSDDEGTEQATPEEQAQYDTFVKLGDKLISEGGEKILDLIDEDPADLLKILGDIPELRDPTPSMTLAAAAVIVVMETIRRSPEKPDDLIIMHGGKELLETLAQLGADSGGHDYSQDELNQAWLHGQDLYRETASAAGLIDDDALKQQFDEIVTSDKEGRLGQTLPALDKAEVATDEQPEEAPAGEEDDGRIA